MRVHQRDVDAVARRIDHRPLAQLKRAVTEHQGHRTLVALGGIAVYTQDDPSFPESVPDRIDDTELSVSHRLGIEIVPTLIRFQDGQDVGRTHGWDRAEWERISGFQGIGAGFIPKNLHTDLLDGVIQVDAEVAREFGRRSAREEGLLVGISSGATLAAISQKLADIPQGAKVLGFNYDTGERYLSVDGYLPA